MDIICRKKRMQGYNVLFPIGYDAFGLPTENYAVQHKIHPAKVTHDNIENFRKQLHMLGYSFDWDREVNTTDLATTSGLSGSFCRCSRRALPTRPPCR